MPTRSELLADIPLFALLDEQERSNLAARLDDVTFAAGTTLFTAGDPGESMFIVVSGEVEIFFRNNTGQPIVLELATPGHFIGEISLLDGGARSASAVANTDVQALVVDRGDLDEFLRTCPAAALDLLGATGRRLRESAELLRHTATRDANEIEEDLRTRVMKIADWISEFSGSLPFLFIHCVLFFVWIILNVGPLGHSRIGGWDPFPFGLLTMVVSLEAIILSVFVLLSQNRQVARDRVRNDIEYDVNLKAELEVAELHKKMDHLGEEILGRLARLERSLGVGQSPATRRVEQDARATKAETGS
jgi:CRP/FNR family transcriptional regulator, cyclic AMP receptor protein